MAAEDRVNSRKTILVGSLLLASCWCISALAASNSGIACDDSTRRLQSLQVSVESLAVQSVDRIGNSAESGPNPADAAAEAATQAAAPILYLAPHIAAMFNSVFDSSDDTAMPQAEFEAAKLPADGRAMQQRDSVRGTTAPMNAVVPDNEVARFHRQMYRKDI